MKIKYLFLLGLTFICFPQDRDEVCVNPAEVIAVYDGWCPKKTIQNGLFVFSKTSISSYACTIIKVRDSSLKVDGRVKDVVKKLENGQ